MATAGGVGGNPPEERYAKPYRPHRTRRPQFKFGGAENPAIPASVKESSVNERICAAALTPPVSKKNVRFTRVSGDYLALGRIVSRERTGRHVDSRAVRHVQNSRGVRVAEDREVGELYGGIVSAT